MLPTAFCCSPHPDRSPPSLVELHPYGCECDAGLCPPGGPSLAHRGSEAVLHAVLSCYISLHIQPEAATQQPATYLQDGALPHLLQPWPPQVWLFLSFRIFKVCITAVSYTNCLCWTTLTCLVPIGVIILWFVILFIYIYFTWTL